MKAADPAPVSSRYHATCVTQSAGSGRWGTGGDIAIAAFVGLVAERDPERIARLDRLLEAMRRALTGERKAG